MSFVGKFNRISLLVFLASAPALIFAQSNTTKLFTHEVGINIDNDQPFETDQYYTAGQDFYYRFIVHPNFFLIRTTDSSKTIFTIHYGNKVFNPKNLDTTNPQEMDRPYCGWNFLNAEVQHFKSKNASNLFAIQVGVVGSESGMGTLQQWWHKTINLYALEGWGSQISNEFVVNMNYNHAHAFPIMPGFEMVSNSNVWVGTGNNKLSEEIVLRLFNFNPLRESTFLNSKISPNKLNQREFFLFTSLNTDYVISNIFLQGSLFKDNPSPYTTDITPWFFTTKVGLMYSSNRMSFAASIVHLSKENSLVSTHNYANLSLAYRF